MSPLPPYEGGPLHDPGRRHFSGDGCLTPTAERARMTEEALKDAWLSEHTVSQTAVYDEARRARASESALERNLRIRDEAFAELARSAESALQQACGFALDTGRELAELESMLAVRCDCNAGEPTEPHDPECASNGGGDR
jgi:hypothetical protein